jgi:hypothetical protein
MILQQKKNSIQLLVTSHQKSEWLFSHFSSQTKEKVILMLISVGTSIDNLAFTNRNC